MRVAIPGSDGIFLRRIFGWTITLRYLGAILLNVYATSSQFAAAFWGDSGTYDDGGWLLALRWKGELLVSPTFTSSVSGFGFHYFVAILYYLFGRNQMLVQF